MRFGLPGRHDELLQHIGGMLLDAAPAGFRRIDLLVRMTVGVQDAVLTVYLPDGSTSEVFPPDGLIAAFGELRQMLYRPGRGTWFSARCVVNAPARIDITYDVDHDPLFTPPVPAADFARDLEVFPRDEAHIPGWLRGREHRGATARQLDAEDQNAILGSVTTLLVQRLPGHWEQLFVDFRMMGRQVEAEVSGLTMFGSSFDWELPPETLPLFVRLRDGMARPGRGTWFTMKFHLVQPDTYSAEFDRDHEPDWTQPPGRQHHVEELATYPRDNDAIPAWLHERVGSSLFVAPVFDQADASVHHRPAVHPQERDDVLAYLENAPIVLSARSSGPDVLRPDAPPAVPLSSHTDGTWVWPGAVAYYLREHHVPPAPQLVAHIRDNEYTLPSVSPEAADAASAVATGRIAAAAPPEYRPRVVSALDQRTLDQLKARLDHFGVPEYRYGIFEPKPDAFVIEPAPGPSGWQVQFWDSNRGPHGRPRVYEHAVDAAKVLLAELLWHAD